MGKDTHIVLNKIIISSNREGLMVSETSKFDWTPDDIRIQKISRKKKTLTLWPLFMDGVQLPQG